MSEMNKSTHSTFRDMICKIKRRISKLKSENPSTPFLKPHFMSQDPQYSTYSIGEYTYGKPKIYSWDDKTKLSIGKYCSFADNVQIILGGEHRTDWVTTYPFNVLFPEANEVIGHPGTKGDIVIGNDVWIGGNVLILSGVNIGNGAAVAAGSVVTKSIDPYTIVGGNPARFIRNRFEPRQVDALQKIAWWDWPSERITEALPYLLSEDIEVFIERYDKMDHGTSL